MPSTTSDDAQSSSLENGGESTNNHQSRAAGKNNENNQNNINTILRRTSEYFDDESLQCQLNRKQSQVPSSKASSLSDRTRHFINVSRINLSLSPLSILPCFFLIFPTKKIAFAKKETKLRTMNIIDSAIKLLKVIIASQFS
jgi:hypothetical protein